MFSVLIFDSNWGKIFFLLPLGLGLSFKDSPLLSIDSIVLLHSMIAAFIVTSDKRFGKIWTAYLPGHIKPCHSPIHTQSLI